MKHLFSLLTALFFMQLSAPVFAQDQHLQSKDKMTVFSVNDPAVKALIDKDQQLIARQGYGNLILPPAINKIDKTKIPADAMWVCDQLNKAGYSAFLIGGSIRDLILGKDADDYDVVTNATHKQMEKIFGSRLHSHYSGDLLFERVTVTEGQPDIDLAAYRQWPKIYNDNGIVDPEPNKQTILDDSFCRDLPFNALYYEPSTGNVYDFHGGLADIRDKTIHALVPDPNLELTYNPTIIPRTLRFQAKYQYALDRKFDEALMKRSATLMHEYPVNVLMGNISKGFFDGYGERCYNNMVKYGIFDYCFPVLKELPDRAAYDKWILAQIRELDKEEKAGRKVTYGYPIALFTYPVYSQLRKTMTAEQAAQHIFDALAPVQSIIDSDKTVMKAAYEELYAKHH